MVLLIYVRDLSIHLLKEQFRILTSAVICMYFAISIQFYIAWLCTIRPMPRLLYGMDLGHMKMKAPFLYGLQNTKKRWGGSHNWSDWILYWRVSSYLCLFQFLLSVNQSLSIQSFHCTFFISWYLTLCSRVWFAELLSNWNSSQDLWKQYFEQV